MIRSCDHHPLRPIRVWSVKYVVTFAFVAVCTGIFTPIIGGCQPNYSNGERVGTITKFSEKGAFVKSHEGTLLMGGLRPGAEGGAVANVWDFNVQDPELVKKIQAAMESGKPVTLVYHEWLMRPSFTQDSSHTVTGIK